MIYAAVGSAELRRRLASKRSRLAHVWRAHERGERKPYSAEEETRLVESEAIMGLTLESRSASGTERYFAVVDELCGLPQKRVPLTLLANSRCGAMVGKRHGRVHCRPVPYTCGKNHSSCGTRSSVDLPHHWFFDFCIS